MENRLRQRLELDGPEAGQMAAMRVPNTADHRANSAPADPVGLVLLAVSLGALLTGAILLAMSGLRESQLFWRNAGGYPVWLREVVHYAFYPLLIGNMLLAIWASWLALRYVRTGRPARGALTLLALVWLLVCAVLVTVITNNVDNLLQERPLHWHDEQVR